MSSPTDLKALQYRRSSLHHHQQNHSPGSSPQLMTPNGTPPPHISSMQQHHNHNFPPTFSEARLAQLLSNFDHGTHSFDRAERESPEERRMSFGDILPPRPANRRPSFLSGLSLTRPGFGFSSTPSSGTSTPTSASHPKDNLLASLAMTSAHPTTAEPEPIARPKSTPIVSHTQQPIPNKAEPTAYMQRLNTAPQKVAAMGYSYGHHEEQRHFDPSKEPRLLGIL